MHRRQTTTHAYFVTKSALPLRTQKQILNRKHTFSIV